MVNEFYSNGVSRGDFEALLLMLSPFAPHMVEELWEQKGFAVSYTHLDVYKRQTSSCSSRRVSRRTRCSPPTRQGRTTALR